MDWECGGRDKATCERLIERLTRWRTRLYCADNYAVYDVLLPVGQLYTGKDETHGVERDNARQRHWLARFRRDPRTYLSQLEQLLCQPALPF